MHLSHSRMIFFRMATSVEGRRAMSLSSGFRGVLMPIGVNGSASRSIPTLSSTRSITTPTTAMYLPYRGLSTAKSARLRLITSAPSSFFLHTLEQEHTVRNKLLGRSFHSTPTASFIFGLGGPYEVYNSRSSRNPLNSLAPAPVRVFGWVAAAAAIVFFIPVAFIIMATPPILLGIYLLTMRLKSVRNKLHNQRWSNMGSYHLTFEPDDAPGAQLRLSIPEVAKKRVLSALELNEDGIAGDIGVSDADVNSLRFTDVQSIQQDFKGSSQGFQEKMEIRSYGLVDISTNQQVATVFLIIHRSLGVSTKSKMRIEVVTTGYNKRTYVLDEPQYSEDEEDVVIDVKPNNGRKSD